MDRPRLVGMAWYRREEYPRLRTMMADTDRLPERYADWLLSAEQVEREVVRSGVAVARVILDPDAFVAWCASQGLPCDGAARSRYASERAATSAP